MIQSAQISINICNYTLVSCRQQLPSCRIWLKLSEGDAYPELRKNAEQVMDIINENEVSFLSSLERGRRIIERTVQQMEPSANFPTEVAWSLYGNLGFPLDLIDLMLEEKGIRLDSAAFNELLLEDAKRKAHGPQEGQQLEGTVVHLDVHSLAQLQRDNIPATDDSPKYSYKLGQHGQYGHTLPHRVSSSLWWLRDP